MTKQQVVTKVKDLEEDNKALWHITRCLEEQLIKINKEIEQLHEDITNKTNTCKKIKADK